MEPEVSTPEDVHAKRLKRNYSTRRHLLSFSGSQNPKATLITAQVINVYDTSTAISY